MSSYYLDTSAAVKLLKSEPHSGAFASFYDTSAHFWASSTLTWIEFARVVRRTLPHAVDGLLELLDGVARIPMDDRIVEAAMAEPDTGLRALDAIHLASAGLLAPELDGLVTYDRRLGVAARAAGLPVASPGRTDVTGPDVG